jgi:hypothetical protein
MLSSQLSIISAAVVGKLIQYVKVGCPEAAEAPWFLPPAQAWVTGISKHITKSAKSAAPLSPFFGEPMRIFEFIKNLREKISIQAYARSPTIVTRGNGSLMYGEKRDVLRVFGIFPPGLG